jgi:hypothetical protein
LQQQTIQHFAVFDGVFQIVDLGAVRRNDADAQRGAILTGCPDAGAYWRKLKQRLNAEGSQPVTFCHGLKLATPDIRPRAIHKHGLKNGYCRLNRSSSASR